VKGLKAKAAAKGVGRKVSTPTTASVIVARKPKQYEWIRVHPDAENYSIVLPIVLFGKDEETGGNSKAKIEKADRYVIHPDMMDDPRLAEDAVKYSEYALAITRTGKLFVWQHTFLDRENVWIDTEEENMAKARTKWIRQISGDGQYNRKESLVDFGKPAWPTRDFDSILIEALGEKFVARPDHELFAKLDGLDK
jgi:hypothetical protein